MQDSEYYDITQIEGETVKAHHPILIDGIMDICVTETWKGGECVGVGGVQRGMYDMLYHSTKSIIVVKQ